jgi:hypothetical protein
MAEPTAPPQDEADAFTALVDLIIEQAREQGEALTRDEADTRAKNLLKNAADPNYKSPDQRLNDVETQVANHEDRIAHLEEIGGGTVVGG